MQYICIFISMERLGLSVTAPGVASNSEQQSCRLLTLALQSGAAQTCTSAEHDVYNAAQACNTQRADSDACADGDECAMWCQMCYHTVDEFLAKVKGMSKEDAKAFRKQHLTVTAENVTYEDSDEVRSVQSSFKYTNTITMDGEEQAVSLSGTFDYHHRVRSFIEHRAIAKVRPCLACVHAVGLHRHWSHNNHSHVDSCSCDSSTSIPALLLSCPTLCTSTTSSWCQPCERMTVLTCLCAVLS